MAEEWAHWRGSSRNGLIGEASGWEQGFWPPQKELWRKEVGEGSSSPLVIGRRVYTMGWRNGKDEVVCLDAVTGKTRWVQSYQSPEYGRFSLGDKGIYSGPSSTPEFDLETGRMYTLSVDGDLRCWDTRREGQLTWAVNLYESFEVPQRPRVGRSGHRDYGYTSSPLLHGDALIVEAGAKEGNLIGFDKRTGKRLWASEATSSAGHTGGPVPMTVQGVPCVAVLNHDGLLVVRVDKGKEGRTVAIYPWVTFFANNVATPTVSGNHVLLTSAYNHNKIAKIRVTLRGATNIWEQPQPSKVCSPVIYEGHVYWAWRQLVCLDYETGEVKWQGGNHGDAGSCLVTSDGRLIVWSGNGTLTLVETAGRSPDRYEELASKKRSWRDDAWPHVVLSGGRLYCKDRQGNLVCFPLTTSGFGDL